MATVSVNTDVGDRVEVNVYGETREEAFTVIYIGSSSVYIGTRGPSCADTCESVGLALIKAAIQMRALPGGVSAVATDPVTEEATEEVMF